MQKIENLNIIPISQLIYLKYNSSDSKIARYKINKTIDKRLMVDYQLNKIQSKMLIALENNTILESLNSNKELAFLNEYSAGEILNIIYSKLQFKNYSINDTTYTDEFDNLSLSELSLINYISSGLVNAYKKRANTLVEKLRNGEIEVYDRLEETVNLRKFHGYLSERSKLHFLNQPYFLTKEQAMNQFEKEQKYIVSNNKKLSQEIIRERSIIKNYKETEKIYQKISNGK